MPSDYEKICKDNIRRRGEEFDDIGRLISEQLYSDRTHFIYELLQNAEDALGRRKRNNPESELPTSVKFLLYKDRLEFRHFGEIFNTYDVKGITDVLKGTKSEDKIQIGKFGIGFKSVYAFTSTPEIHSGDEHFIIERYIRPRSTDRIPQIADGETVFVFPFNHKDLSKEQAFQLIEEKLKKIGSRVLLFLRNITEIEWKIEDQEEGLYLKESKQQGRFAQKVTVIGQHGNEDEEEEWLVFRRQIEVVNSSVEGFVEVAFRLIEDKKEGKKIIRRIESSPLVVYFPTKLETRFGFLVHGPYDTTASRSDIEDNKWNNDLIKETAFLVSDHVLPTLKQMGLLTVSFLEALPIRMDDFPEDSMFYPIVEAVRNSLLDQELLPADDGTFVSARNAKLARGAELRNLLTHDQLRELFQSDDDIKWLSGEITQDRTPDLRSYLMSELDVEEITPDGFARRISSTFLASQTDDWFIAFYKYLSGQEALWRSPRWAGDSGGLLRRKPILRLQDNKQEVPFRSDGMANAYLPPPEETDFPVVKREIVDNEQALKFLRRLGLSEPDVFDDIVERVLPKYSRQDVSSITLREHAMDIQKILRAMASDSEAGKKKVLRAAKNAPFLRAVDRRGKVAFQKPGDIYVKDEDLQLYFSKATDVWFLDETSVDLPPDAEAWANLGVALRPRRVPFSGGLPSNEREYSTRQESIENYDLDGLDKFLEHLDETLDIERRRKLSLVLWNYLREHLDSNPRFFKGRYEWFYHSPHTKYFDSRMLVRLRESAWITTRDGNLEKPSDITVSQLGEEFIGADELMEILGIRQDTDQDISGEERSQVIRDIGFESTDEAQKMAELLRLFKVNGESPDAWIEEYKSRNKPVFPRKVSANPDRRQERVAEQMNDAPEKEYEQRNRSVRTTKGAIDPILWLRNQYTNDSGQMICQICKEEMPFKKHDGKYYFEAVEALSKDFFPKEHEAQFLALCPLCAAKYKEFVKRDKEAMEKAKDDILNHNGNEEDENPEIDIRLDQPATIKFVQTHFDDLRTIMKEYDNEKGLQG